MVSEKPTQEQLKAFYDKLLEEIDPEAIGRRTFGGLMNAIDPRVVKALDELHRQISDENARLRQQRDDLLAMCVELLEFLDHGRASPGMAAVVNSLSNRTWKLINRVKDEITQQEG